MKKAKTQVKLNWSGLLGFDQVKSAQGRSSSPKGRALVGAKIGTKLGTKGPV